MAAWPEELFFEEDDASDGWGEVQRRRNELCNEVRQMRDTRDARPDRIHISHFRG